MRIQPGEIIAGHPALTMRTLMKRGRTYGPATSGGNSIQTIATVLQVTREAAQAVFQELCALGYIEPVPTNHPLYQKDHWFTTIKGNALANASARKPITRQTADHLIAQFLARVQQVNSGDYAYRVKQVILFGSYLGDAPTLGDVDLSIELEDRYPDANTRKRGHEARIAATEQAGRYFPDFMARLTWPEQEVWLFLRHRSPSLSLHDEAHEHILAQPFPSRILFQTQESSGPHPNPSHSAQQT